MFEVEHLKYATLATVSRCGMIWFSEDVVEPYMVYRHYLDTLSSVPLDADDEDAVDLPGRRAGLSSDSGTSTNLVTQKLVAQILELYFTDGELVSAALTSLNPLSTSWILLRLVHLTRCSLSSTRPFEMSSSMTSSIRPSLLSSWHGIHSYTRP